MTSALAALLFAAAVPDDPALALKALAAIGDAGRCVAREVIEAPPGEEAAPAPGDLEPEEAEALEDALPPRAKGPVKRRIAAPLSPKLKGKAEKIVPFAAHWNEGVARKAVDLLCAIQDAPARGAIRDLQSRYPCRRWLADAYAGAGIEGAPAHCPRPEESPGQDLVGNFAAWAETGKAADAFGKRLAAGDDKAFAEAFRAAGGMDKSKARAAAAALSKVDTAPGFLKLARAYEKWRGAGWEEPFLDGVGGASLGRLAKAKGKPPYATLLEVARGAKPAAGALVSLSGVAAVLAPLCAGSDACKLAEAERARGKLEPNAEAFLDALVARCLRSCGEADAPAPDAGPR